MNQYSNMLGTEVSVAINGNDENELLEKARRRESCV